VNIIRTRLHCDWSINLKFKFMGSLFSLLSSLFSGKQLELCLVGLENSGKTTLLNVLSMGYPVETLPTVI
jgi:GTPase SAR1 family protein